MYITPSEINFPQGLYTRLHSAPCGMTGNRPFNRTLPSLRRCYSKILDNGSGFHNDSVSYLRVFVNQTGVIFGRKFTNLIDLIIIFEEKVDKKWFSDIIGFVHICSQKYLVKSETPEYIVGEPYEN